MGELRKRGGIWQIRYYRNGQRFEESSGSSKKRVAVDLLRQKEGDGSRGLPVTPQVGKLWFDDAAKDLINDYKINRKKSIDEVARRIEKHLRPHFGNRRMAAIKTADVREFIVKRQSETTITTKARDITLKDGTVRRIPERTRAIDGVSNAEINRELTILKRMFTLAVQSGKLLYRPHIPLLKEDNTRTGFFEPEQFASVYAHLPEPLKPILEFAYITGWRIVSEVLPLEWRQVDLEAGEVRLDPGTTKNGDGRVFPFTDDLRRLLEEQHAEHVKLRKSGKVEPHVFFRMVAKGRRGTKAPRPIRSLNKAFEAACIAAGCPGRIPHDLRRTAVRNMVRRGVPERVAMELSGHKTRSVFERYNIVSSGDLRAAAAQLRGLTGTKKGQSGAPSLGNEGERLGIAR
jgi:integrase